MNVKEKLRELITSRKATVAVIGQGYVGLPLSLCIASSGFRVFGLDVDPTKVRRLQNGESYITDVSSKSVLEALESGNYHPSLDFHLLDQCDVAIVCVPTPLSKSKDPDMSFIYDAISKMKEFGREGRLIILESTTYPGTTEEIANELSASCGQVGKDFFACFSPERVDPGNATYHTQNTPKVIGGVTDACAEMGELFYQQVMEQVVRVTSARVAEMVKLLENTFRAVNIALVNEMALMSERMEIDIWEVIRAASTKPFGFMPFYPGPGIGGHCIPLDPHYLAWKARSFDFYNKFIELAADINGNMPRHVVTRVAECLNERAKPLKNSKICVLGVAYKKDISDWRESPGAEVIKLLLAAGADVCYSDPYVPTIELGEQKMSSIELTADALKSMDIAILITNHTDFDMELIAQHAPLIFDTRNAFGTVKRESVEKLGTPLTKAKCAEGIAVANVPESRITA